MAPGCPLCVGKISVGIELTHHELQILGKDGSLPTPPTSLPLPQSQISICPHGLHSKSSALHTVANLPNYSKKGGGKKSTSPSSPKSPFHQHVGRVNTAPSK